MKPVNFSDQHVTYTLKALLNDLDDSLTPEEKAEIARQCMQLICVLHDNNMSNEHHTLKPEDFHVTFRSNPETKLDEIKVSLKVSATPVVDSTITALERYWYIPPEQRSQYTHEVSSSFSADVYSLGVIFSGYSKKEIRKTGANFARLSDLDSMNKGLLSDKDLDPEYTKLRHVAKSMRAQNPAERPNLQKLKEACGLAPIPQKPNSTFNTLISGTQEFFNHLLHGHTEAPKPPLNDQCTPVKHFLSIEQMLHIETDTKSVSSDSADSLSSKEAFASETDDDQELSASLTLTVQQKPKATSAFSNSAQILPVTIPMHAEQEHQSTTAVAFGKTTSTYQNSSGTRRTKENGEKDENCSSALST